MCPNGYILYCEQGRRAYGTGNQSAAMYFAVDDAHAFADRAETEYLECRPFFTDARRILRKRTGLYTRIAMKVVDRDYRAKLIRLRL